MNKYLEDHPGFPDRVSHLVGYDELDPQKRTTDQILVQGLHDEQTGRYSIATMKFAQVLKADPANPVALLHMGRTQIALGQTSKSEQTLAEAAQNGTPETRTAALSNIKELRDREIDLARHAEQAYERFVSQWQRRGNGKQRTGAASEERRCASSWLTRKAATWQPTRRSRPGATPAATR